MEIKIADVEQKVEFGQKELMDSETGELITLNHVKKYVCGSRNFWKCYLIDFLTVLGIMESRQLDVFIYIVENTSPGNNVFLGTYKKISTDTGCAPATIARTMKKLQENNFIKKLQNGAWLVNPNILIKGDEKKRQILLSYYESEEPLSLTTRNRTDTHEELPKERIEKNGQEGSIKNGK